MIKNGLQKVRADHRDYDFHKSFGTVGTYEFPDSFSVDASLWMPNQDIPQAFTGIDNVPALPYGCTDYAQTDLCMDEDGQIYSPMLLENETHANQNGGADIRVSLEAAKQVFGRTAYYNIRASGAIDFFDAIRLAMYSGQPEKRAVSIGIPWFQEFERLNPNAVLPIPVLDTANATWHNAVVPGWKSIAGIPYLVVKSWQGAGYGDQGFCYLGRDLCNTLFTISGTGAFTLSKLTPQSVQTVDLTWVQTIVSYVLSLFAQKKSPVAPSITQLITPTMPTSEPMHVSKISDWAVAVKAGEGADPALNNPGNLKYATLTASWGGTKGRQATDGGWICKFPTYAAGFAALCNFLTLGAENQLLAFHQARTLEAFTKVYAGNPPQGYIDGIAAKLGVPVTIDISTLL